MSSSSKDGKSKELCLLTIPKDVIGFIFTFFNEIDLRKDLPKVSKTISAFANNTIQRKKEIYISLDTFSALFSTANVHFSSDHLQCNECPIIISQALIGSNNPLNASQYNRLCINGTENQTEIDFLENSDFDFTLGWKAIFEFLSKYAINIETIIFRGDHSQSYMVPIFNIWGEWSDILFPTVNTIICRWKVCSQTEIEGWISAIYRSNPQTAVKLFPKLSAIDIQNQNQKQSFHSFDLLWIHRSNPNLRHLSYNTYSRCDGDNLTMAPCHFLHNLPNITSLLLGVQSSPKLADIANNDDSNDRQILNHLRRLDLTFSPVSVRQSRDEFWNACAAYFHYCLDISPSLTYLKIDHFPFSYLLDMFNHSNGEVNGCNLWSIFHLSSVRSMREIYVGIDAHGFLYNLSKVILFSGTASKRRANVMAMSVDRLILRYRNCSKISVDIASVIEIFNVKSFTVDFDVCIPNPLETLIDLLPKIFCRPIAHINTLSLHFQTKIFGDRLNCKPTFEKIFKECIEEWMLIKDDSALSNLVLSIDISLENHNLRYIQHMLIDYGYAIRYQRGTKNRTLTKIEISRK